MDIIAYVAIGWIIIACLLPIFAIVYSYRNAKNKKNWDVEIYTNDLAKDQFLISGLLGLKIVRVEKLKKKSLRYQSSITLLEIIVLQ